MSDIITLFCNQYRKHKHGRIFHTYLKQKEKKYVRNCFFIKYDKKTTILLRKFLR